VDRRAVHRGPRQHRGVALFHHSKIRVAAGASGFFTITQSGDCPDQYGRSRRLRGFLRASWRARMDGRRVSPSVIGGPAVAGRPAVDGRRCAFLAEGKIVLSDRGHWRPSPITSGYPPDHPTINCVYSPNGL
jgi:hypothetical protein